MTQGLWRSYTPPGPKALGWLMSDADMAFIIGPYGSAKTTTGAEKCIRTTCQQHPSTKDGVRRALITAVRPNYRRMNDTLVASVQTFFGSDGKWEGASNGPQDFHLEWNERGERCEMDIWFRAFGDMAIESFVRGFQPTAWWCNEFDELPRGMISKMAARAGRYRLEEKPKGVAPPRYCKVFGDANMPDLDNWTHDLILNVAKPDPTTEVYLQPSGFDPNAENLENLRLIDPNYYEAMAAKFRQEGDEASVKRFIENVAGYTPHGKPVYPGFRADKHMAKGDLQPDPMRQLVIGVDQGGQAAAIIAQRTRHRTALLLDEVVLEPGAFFGGEEFGRLVGRRMLDKFRRYLRPGGFKIRTDPAAKARHSGTKENDPRSWLIDFEAGFLAETGYAGFLDLDIAPTNAVKARIAAVRKLLAYRAENGNEGLQISRECRVLARGFAGGYRYMTVQGKPGEYHPDPEKNYYSNPHDALQYLALDIVPELAGVESDPRDPYSKIIAAALEPQGPQWGHDQPTEILC